MKPKYIEFIGNHPAEKDEDRQYYENLQENWSSYGAAYGKEYLKVEITDYDKTTGELIELVRGKVQSDAVVAILDTEKAIKHCRFAVDNNAIPLAPHLLFPQFMDEEKERDLAMFMDMVLIGRCEQLWVFGDTITAGMQTEINKANKKCIKIRRFTDLYKEYKQSEV